ncbi:rab-GTPase-TBC domain-containing protein, partial [Blyttiomyces helicus]
ILNYIPYDDRDQWEKVLLQQRSLYYTFVNDLILEPSSEEIETARKSRVVDDHPLSAAPESKWASFFEEMGVLEQIDKDVRRTLPDFAFFQLPVAFSLHSPLTLHNPTPAVTSPASSPATPTTAPLASAYPSIRARRALFKRIAYLHTDEDFGARSHARSPDSPDPKEEQQQNEDTRGDLHWEAIERILFLHSKLNPGVGYVQGLNEILGPVYYVMATDPDLASRAHAEADAFFVFSAIITEFRDHFIRSLDGVSAGRLSRASSASDLGVVSGRRKSASEVATSAGGTDSGIGASMGRLMRALRERDLPLWKDLQLKNIHPAFFAFRWLTVLLTQEFSLPDVIRLWDSILADVALDNRGTAPPSGGKREGRFEFLIDFCCAMLM